MKELYPPIEPFAIHSLDVSGGHRLYVEESGNPEGIPILFLHGGPGAGCRPYHRSFFDPDRYRAILFDQRGCGRSTPYGRLEHNTTDALLADIELIRQRLGLQRWVLSGGSWGAALALLYAQRHPSGVLGLILRGSFLARQRDLDWFLGSGAGRIYPERWQELLKALPPSRHDDVVNAVHDMLHGDDELAQHRIARLWTAWGSQVTLADDFDPSTLDQQSPTALVLRSRIELHYAVHHYFIAEDQILQRCDDLPTVPITLIHGRRDLVCPPDAAFCLHQRIPWAELCILPKGGHIAGGADMVDALVNAGDQMLLRIAP